MESESVEPLVVLRASGLADLAFTSAEAFNTWLSDEAERWKAFKASIDLSSDPIGDLGNLGAAEVVDAWVKLSDQLSRTLDLNDPGVSRVAAAGVARTLNAEFASKRLIPSATSAGRRVLQLHEIDPASARVSLSVLTGRNISRVTHPQHARALWRATLLSAMGIAEDAVTLDRFGAALQSAERSAAEVGALETEARSSISSAKEALANDTVARNQELDTLLEQLEARTDAKLARVEEEWIELRSTYDTKLALKAPRSYWHRRRVVHRWAAAAWGLFAALLVYGTVSALVPRGARLLTDAAHRSKVPFPIRASDGIWNYLPELLQVLVFGFLVLWGLRFALRQVAENLARLEEAAQRVTMVETFLAFSAPADGKQAVVGEADRAVIVQALFRPSSPGSIEDPPPVHWIEEVLRRLRAGN